MGTRRKRPHTGSSRHGQTTTDHVVKETLEDTDAPLPPVEPVVAQAELPASAVEHHDPSVHETLLETVSPDSVLLVPPVSAPRGAEVHPKAAPSDPSPPVPARIPAAPPRAPIPRGPDPAINALSELTEANAATVTFLRNEGSAALAHWRALSQVRSPGDALRLQMNEAQRAADASLTLLGTLSRRAARLAQAMRRR